MCLYCITMQRKDINPDCSLLIQSQSEWVNKRNFIKSMISWNTANKRTGFVKAVAQLSVLQTYIYELLVHGDPVSSPTWVMSWSHTPCYCLPPLSYTIHIYKNVQDFLPTQYTNLNSVVATNPEESCAAVFLSTIGWYIFKIQFFFINICIGITVIRKKCFSHESNVTTQNVLMWS